MLGRKKKFRVPGFEFRVKGMFLTRNSELGTRNRRAGAALACLLLLAAAACKEGGVGGFGAVEPRSLRDVPAARLAFRFAPDVAEETLPERVKRDEAEEPLPSILADFQTRRGNTEAVVRTVLDPRGQRALALYGTGETQTDFRLDLYSAEGQFIRNVFPHELTGVFPAEVAWSPDGERIAFSGIRNPALQASPTPDAGPPPDPVAPPVSDPSVVTPTPTPSAAIPSVAVFRTEQVYVGDRDGYSLRPLTTREGLIYFQLAWSPDGQTIAALACREDEWNARRDEGKLPAGRPRLISLEGQERLLDDRLTDVAPVWSPDGSKVATAFDYDVAVYDAAGSAPTAAAFPVGDPLRTASAAYDARVFGKGGPTPGGDGKETSTTPADAAPDAGAAGEVLISLNPFVRLEWVEPETLYAQTAFVRFYRNEPVPTLKYTRWHVLHLSAQAAVLSGNKGAGCRVSGVGENICLTRRPSSDIGRPFSPAPET
jgi:WD40-like Beta Propeller Repeat